MSYVLIRDGGRWLLALCFQNFWYLNRWSWNSGAEENKYLKAAGACAGPGVNLLALTSTEKKGVESWWFWNVTPEEAKGSKVQSIVLEPDGHQRKTRNEQVLESTSKEQARILEHVAMGADERISWLFIRPATDLDVRHRMRSHDRNSYSSSVTTYLSWSTSQRVWLRFAPHWATRAETGRFTGSRRKEGWGRKQDSHSYETGTSGEHRAPCTLLLERTIMGWLLRA